MGGLLVRQCVLLFPNRRQVARAATAQGAASVVQLRAPHGQRARNRVILARKMQRLHSVRGRLRFLDLVLLLGRELPRLVLKARGRDANRPLLALHHLRLARVNAVLPARPRVLVSGIRLLLARVPARVRLLPLTLVLAAVRLLIRIPGRDRLSRLRFGEALMLIRLQRGVSSMQNLLTHQKTFS